jgi:hypothetical protein
MPDHGFRVAINKDNTVSIDLGAVEKSQVMGELSKCYVTMGKMQKWLDDNTVPIEQRERYMPMFRELLHTISFLWDFLKKAGVTDQDIREGIEIPF